MIVLRFPSISKGAHIWNARSAHELAPVVLSEGALTGHGPATQNGISSSNWSEPRAPQAALGRGPLGARAWTPPHLMLSLLWCPHSGKTLGLDGSRGGSRGSEGGSGGEGPLKPGHC